MRSDWLQKFEQPNRIFKMCYILLSRCKFINCLLSGCIKNESISNDNNFYITAISLMPCHKQLVISIRRLSAPPSHLQDKKNPMGTFFSVISVMVGHFDCKHRCHIEQIVSIEFILPSRWQDGAENLQPLPHQIYYLKLQ